MTRAAPQAASTPQQYQQAHRWGRHWIPLDQLELNRGRFLTDFDHQDFPSTIQFGCLQTFVVSIIFLEAHFAQSQNVLPGQATLRRGNGDSKIGDPTILVQYNSITEYWLMSNDVQSIPRMFGIWGLWFWFPCFNPSWFPCFRVYYHTDFRVSQGFAPQQQQSATQLVGPCRYHPSS